MAAPVAHRSSCFLVSLSVSCILIFDVLHSFVTLMSQSYRKVPERTNIIREKCALDIYGIDDE